MAKVNVKTKPWQTPKFIVLLGEGKEISVSIKDVSPDELNSQAREWLEHLFASIGRKNPFILKADPA